MPEIGDWRYFVEYLDHAQGIAAIKEGGGDPDDDTMWDYCDQDEITVCKEFPTKSRAVAWARKNKKLDVFHMPRIVEQTYRQEFWSDSGAPIPGQRSWEQTGYWEIDGRDVTEIDEAA